MGHLPPRTSSAPITLAAVGTRDGLPPGVKRHETADGRVSYSAQIVRAARQWDRHYSTGRLATVELVPAKLDQLGPQQPPGRPGRRPASVSAPGAPRRPRADADAENGRFEGE